MGNYRRMYCNYFSTTKTKFSPKVMGLNEFEIWGTDPARSAGKMFF